ncbi:MAG: HTTM domain-containing protein [Candidatus Binatia bacterium]
MSFARRALAAWRRFWFREGSLVHLAIARILLASIVLSLDSGGRFLRVGLVAPEQWTPIPALQLLGIGQPDLALLESLDLATRAALIASGLGVLTNLSLFVAFLLQLVQEAWLNSFGKVTHATIPLLYALLFFACSPCGRRLSVDAGMKRCWRRLRGGGEEGARPDTSVHARWPLELLFIELAAFYFQAGLAKLQSAGPAWADGYTLQFYLLQKDTAAGVWLAGHLGLCAALSAAVLVFELCFPVAIVAHRLRPWFLAGGLLFHLGTSVFLGVVFWPLWVLYVLFLPWDRVAAAVGKMLTLPTGGAPRPGLRRYAWSPAAGSRRRAARRPACRSHK